MEDKLSVIAKNSSPNASPVQLSVGRVKINIFLIFPLILFCAFVVKNESPNYTILARCSRSIKDNLGI
ncbi:hypothetical protein [Dolichospermum circinale]|uniref:hypothetical protein n=1 Tax=Dolichospermum circinale TaxID=109265 RepID=UPI00232ECB8E|nr:hypothetical protein [Dolichospermum circinale]MDB9448912.1 hypothetical protein [Dolichospermum circinale CS-547]